MVMVGIDGKSKQFRGANDQIDRLPLAGYVLQFSDCVRYCGVGGGLSSANREQLYRFVCNKTEFQCEFNLIDISFIGIGKSANSHGLCNYQFGINVELL